MKVCGDTTFIVAICFKQSIVAKTFVDSLKTFDPIRPSGAASTSRSKIGPVLGDRLIVDIGALLVSPQICLYVPRTLNVVVVNV